MAKLAELISNTNEILYPTTVASQVLTNEVIGERLPQVLDRIDRDIASVTNEVVNARTDNKTPSTTHPNLKARLDDLDGRLTALDITAGDNTNEIANITTNLNAFNKEVEQARTDNQNPAHTYNSLKERLDADAQEVINARTDSKAPIETHNSLKERLDSDYDYLNSEIEETNIRMSRIKIFAKDFGAVGNGTTDDTQAVVNAMDYLESIGGGILVFDKGTYLLNYFLLRENTKLEIRPNAILKSVTGVLCSNFLANETNTTGYNGRGNIVIYGGGTIDMNAMAHQSSGTVVQFGHCSNIKIKDITFKNIADDHAVEFVGVENFEVINCRFIDYKDFKNDGSKKYKEAIQIDFCLPNHGGGGQQDGTPCINGVIDGCIFDKINANMEYFPSAIGSHGVGVVKNCDNIIVRNCVIKGCKDAGIFAFHWDNSIIENNKIFNSGGFGVVVEFCNDVNVKSNLVDNAIDGICIYDSSSVREEQNVVKNTQRHGSHIKKLTREIYVYNNVFKNNNLEGGTFSAIAVGHEDNTEGITTGVEISGNKIISDNQLLAYGIDIRPSCENINYYNNTITAHAKTARINDRQKSNVVLPNRATLFTGDVANTNTRVSFAYPLSMFDEYEFTVNGNGIECRRFLATEPHPKVRVFNLSDGLNTTNINFYEMNIDMHDDHLIITNNIQHFWDGNRSTKTNSADGSGLHLLKVVGIRYNDNKITK